MLETVCVSIAIAALVGAALWNWLLGVVPNKLIIGFMAAFVPFGLVSQMAMGEVIWHLVAFALALVLFIGLFAAGIVGGGGAKLAAAVTLWLPSGWAFTFIGLAIAMIFMIRASEWFLSPEAAKPLARHYATGVAALGSVMMALTIL
ncbi:MAG: hypothetical protein R3D33_02320 [Hyphomicrobiaceae bacterium]